MARVDVGAVKDRAVGVVRKGRRRSGWFDHGVATLAHYTRVDGNAQAAATTYFAFLSFFPLLAIAFFAVGLVSSAVPEARANLENVLDTLLPGLVGTGDGQVPLEVFEDNGTRVGLLGLAGALYAGSRWLSGMRTALARVFVVPREERRNFFLGKGWDLLTMGTVGLLLALSVGLSGVVSSLSRSTLALVGVDGAAAAAVLWLVGHTLGVASSTVLFFAVYTMLPPLNPSRRARLEGALLSAVAFEVLKALAYVVIDLTRGQPAFQAFGIALVLVVWISYFSRILLLGAAWAHTAPGEGDAGTQPEARPEPRGEDTAGTMAP